MIATSEPRTTAICFTSAHATASTPPMAVYSTVGMPMSNTQYTRSQPNTALSTTLGAAMMVPADMPRESRKSRLVSERVFASKRRSRYSYAVYTFAPCRNGTRVTPSSTMATGRPK